MMRLLGLPLMHALGKKTQLKSERNALCFGRFRSGAANAIMAAQRSRQKVVEWLPAMAEHQCSQ